MRNGLMVFIFSLLAVFGLSAHASNIQTVADKLHQPVALGWINQQLAIVDLEGIHFFDKNRLLKSQNHPVSGTVTDIFSNGDTLWLADPDQKIIQKINAKGESELSLSANQLLPLTNQDPQSTPLKPAEPVSVAVNHDTLYWADRANQQICRFDLLKKAALDCFGHAGEMEGEFQYPYQMAIDRDGYVFVVDILNARIQVFDPKGKVLNSFGQFGIDENFLFRPNGIAISQDQDLVFVSDSYFGTIHVFKKGESLGKLRDDNKQIIKFKSPTGLAFQDHHLYVADTQSGTIFSIAIDAATLPSAAPAPTSQFENSQKNCLLCHLSWTEQAKQPDQQGSLPEASEHMCYSCHNGAIVDSRLRIGQGEQHASIYDDQAQKDKRHKKERKDKLPDIFPKTADKELRCSACHTPHTQGENHDTLYNDHHNAWLRVPNHNGDMCERCHESKIKNARELDPKKRGINHPLSLKMQKPAFENQPGVTRDHDLQKGLPDELKAAGAVLGHANEVVCQSCHQIHGGHDQEALNALPMDKSQLCGSCHQRQNSHSIDEARKKGVHPVNIKPKKPMKRHDQEVTFVNCESCHKVHDGQSGPALLEDDLDDINQLCESCHQRQHAKDKEDAQKKGIHPVNIKLEDAVDIAGQKTKEVKCLTCHAVHNGKPETPNLVEDHRNGELCSHCHVGKQTIVGSDHDLRITAQKKTNQFDELPTTGVCGSCHTLHRGDQHSTYLDATKQVAPSNQDPDADKAHLKTDKLCINCHQKKGIAEKKIVEYFSHPHKDLILRSDKHLMPLLAKNEKIEEFGEIACVTCHDPHFWDPDSFQNAKTNPQRIKPTGNKDNIEGTPLTSFLNSKGVAKRFCVDCHGLESMIKFKYFHDKETARNRKLDYLE